MTTDSPDRGKARDWPSQLWRKNTGRRIVTPAKKRQRQLESERWWEERDMISELIIVLAVPLVAVPLLLLFCVKPRKKPTAVRATWHRVDAALREAGLLHQGIYLPGVSTGEVD